MWWANGKRKSRVLGLVKDMTKSKAREEVGRIVAEENAKRLAYRVWPFGKFVEWSSNGVRFFGPSSNPIIQLERETGIEPATFSLGS